MFGGEDMVVIGNWLSSKFEKETEICCVATAGIQSVSLDGNKTSLLAFLMVLKEEEQ